MRTVQQGSSSDHNLSKSQDETCYSGQIYSRFDICKYTNSIGLRQKVFLKQFLSWIQKFFNLFDKWRRSFMEKTQVNSTHRGQWPWTITLQFIRVSMSVDDLLLATTARILFLFIHIFCYIEFRICWLPGLLHL